MLVRLARRWRSSGRRKAVFSGWTARYSGERENKEGALKLINFLLRPDVAKEVAETIGYPTPNLAARKLLSPEVANDKSLYPDAQTISKGEWQNDVGDASAIYEEYYQKLKAGR